MIEPHKFVEKTITEALTENASDIFFLPQQDNFNIRIKVDGVQKNVTEIPHDYGEMCVAHIKSLAGLLTYRSKIAQDGVIRELGDKEVAKFANSELRVSTFPSMYGERIAIRIIKDAETKQYLDDLGFQPEIAEKLKQMTLKASGLTILTGPTGCGKTTTIYAMIREFLRTSQDPASIITIEDPIECDIAGISQTAVTSDDEDWSYAQALRAALRQDVKTLVIGEMRDREVVKVAMDAALTGHRVITTFHAGDIPSVYARILHQGFEPFLISAAITGVVTQRLVKSPGNDQRCPVVALLEAHDTWKDFISENPGLGAIREKIRTIPHADLVTEAVEMAKNGIIAENWQLEI